MVVAEDLRARVADQPIGSVELQVTISLGVAEWRDEAEDGLIRRADVALYEAKAAGRNTFRRAAVALA